MMKVMLLIVLVQIASGNPAPKAENGIADDLANEKLHREAQEALPEDCSCPQLNSDLVCKKGQKKMKFYLDNRCKCPQMRCIWITCPEVEKPACKKCEKVVEVEDCGCKSFQCENINPNHCKLKPVECGPCQKLEHSKDECGCHQEKCIPLPAPTSQCGKCTQCEECKSIDAEPQECGLKQEVCIPKTCPPFIELRCDKDCEEAKFKRDACNCSFMECHKLNSNKEPPQCEPCHELRRMKIERCEMEKFSCVPAPCKGPPKGQEVCYKTDENGAKDDCGCPKLHKKKCDVVPAGDCPEGTSATGGTDLCGCPHQVCVSCSQLYPDPECKECQTVKEVDMGDCKDRVCVDTPECKGLDPCHEVDKINQDKECPNCQKLVSKEIGPPGKGCMVKVCVKDNDDPKCVLCTNSTDSLAPPCGKCKRPRSIDPGNGCKVWTCVDKSAKECELPTTKCTSCETAKYSRDDCGCPEITCESNCGPTPSIEDITCDAYENKKTPTIGKDTCGCDIATCVLCEEKRWM